MRAGIRLLPVLPVLAGLALALGAQAPEGEARDRPGRAVALSLAGTFRLRGELQDEFDVKTFGTGVREGYILSRLRLDLGLRWKSLLEVHAQIQDARALGVSFTDEDFAGGNNPFHDVFDINQLYLEVRPARRIAIKAGRQALSYGDRRVFGPGDWGNTGRYSWDAVRIAYEGKTVSSHALVGRFVLHDPGRWPNARAGGPTAWASYHAFKTLPFDLDLFYIHKYDGRGFVQGEAGTGNLSSHSAGLRFGGRGAGWDYSVLLAGQIGRWGEDDIRAHGLVLSLGRTFDVGWKPHVIAQYILGSGDRDPQDGVHGTFDGLFSGADTVLYGWMNLFFWQNLRECRIDLVLQPAEGLTVRGEIHLFGLDEAADAWYLPGRAVRRDLTGSSGRRLGQEVDLTASKKFSGWFEVLTGVCFFRPGEYVRATGESPAGLWCFLETTFSF